MENTTDISEIIKIKLDVKMYFTYHELLRIKSKLDSVAPGISNDLTRKAKEIATDMKENHYIRTEKSTPAGAYIVGMITGIYYTGLIDEKSKTNALKAFLYDQVYRFFL